MPTLEHIEIFDKKIHNHITQLSSKVGIVLKELKGNESIINERMEWSPAGIDKLKDIINNLGSAFSSVKNIEKTPPSKNCKFVYVPNVRERSNFKIFLHTHKIMVMHSNERGECVHVPS